MPIIFQAISGYMFFTTDEVLPVQQIPVAELVLCAVCRNIVVQIYKSRKIKLHELRSHHCEDRKSKVKAASASHSVLSLTSATSVTEVSGYVSFGPRQWYLINPCV